MLSFHVSTDCHMGHRHHRTNNESFIKHSKLHKTLFYSSCVALSFSFSFSSNYRTRKNYFMHYGCSRQKNTHKKEECSIHRRNNNTSTCKAAKFFNLIHVISSAVANVVRPGNFRNFSAESSSRLFAGIFSWKMFIKFVTYITFILVR